MAKALAGFGAVLHIGTTGCAMTGSFLVWVMYKDHFDATEDQGLKAAPFATAPAIRNKVSNLVSEIIGTFVLIFVIFYFTDASMGTKENTTPIGLGSLVPFRWRFGMGNWFGPGRHDWLCHKPGERFRSENYPLANPDESKGSSDWSYAWVPVIGPIIGSTLAAVVYLLISK